MAMQNLLLLNYEYFKKKKKKILAKLTQGAYDIGLRFFPSNE